MKGKVGVGGKGLLGTKDLKCGDKGTKQRAEHLLLAPSAEVRFPIELVKTSLILNRSLAQGLLLDLVSSVGINQASNAAKCSR